MDGAPRLASPVFHGVTFARRPSSNDARPGDPRAHGQRLDRERAGRALRAPAIEGLLFVHDPVDLPAGDRPTDGLRRLLHPTLLDVPAGLHPLPDLRDRAGADLADLPRLSGRAG